MATMNSRSLLCGILAAGLTAGMAASANAQATLTWGKPSEVLSTDVHVSGDGTSWTVFYLIYDQLLSTDDNLKPAPGLAESWTQNSPTSYTFKLRRDAKFSNGRALEASDVVASLNRMRDPKLGSAWGRQLGPVAEIVAEDAHTVRIELKEPHTPLLSVLSVSTTSILPMKEIEAGTFDPTKGMLGSGPFMVDQHLQDESWTLKRNPHYPRKAGTADTVMIRIIPDDAARIAALRDGRVDMATFENPDTPTLLKGVRNVELFVQQTPNYFRLDVNALQQKSIMSDDKVRKAMHLALDREKIANIVFGGNSGPEYPVPQAFGKEACRKDPYYTTPRPQRLTQARQLLEQSGNKNPKVGLIASSVLVTYPMIAQVIQQNLQEAGFQVDVQQMPAAEWYKRVFAKDADFDMAMSWFAGYTDPSMVLNWWVTGFGGFARGFLKGVPEYDELMPRIRQAAEGPERDKLMARACEIINEQANMLAIVNKPDYIAYRKDLVEPKFSKLEGNFDTFKYIEEFRSKR